MEEIQKEINNIWNIPSDHLPIGTKLKINEKTNISIITWNCLNKAWFNYIKKNSQLLAKTKPMSDINQLGAIGGDMNDYLTKYIFSNYTIKFSKRERMIVDRIIKFLNQNIDIICLQEVSKEIANVLRFVLNNYEKYNFIETKDGTKDNLITIYREDLLYHKNTSVIKYSDKKDSNSILIMEFSLDNEYNLFIANTHPDIIESNILFESLPKTKSDDIFICAGDLNKNPNNLTTLNKNDYISTSSSITHINTETDLSNKFVQFDYILLKKIDSEKIKISYTPITSDLLFCENESKLLEKLHNNHKKK